MTKVVSGLKKLFSSSFIVGCLLSVTLFAATRFYYHSHQDPEIVERHRWVEEVERLHNQTVDIRLRRRGPRAGSNDVAILTIDEQAIQKYGRWPWPRTLVAEVIERVMKGGARTVSFDIIFSEKQESILRSLDQVEENLNRSLPAQQNQIKKILRQAKANQDHDRKLTEVIEAHSENLIMGAVYDELNVATWPAQDLCFLDIAKKNGVFDYWEKEAFLIGVFNRAERSLPDSWHDIILNHFDKLQQGVTLKWLENHPKHPVIDWVVAHQLEPTDPQVLNALTLFVLNRKEAFQETQLATVLPWPQLERQIPQNARVEMRSEMKTQLNQYCLRYLRPNDELRSEFEANWTQITNDYEQLKGITFEQGIDIIKGAYIESPVLENPVQHVGEWLFNIPAVAEVTEHSGTFNATQDKDGSIRRAKLFVRVGNFFIPSLAFKQYLVINELYPVANLIPNPYEDEDEQTSNIVTNVKLENSDGEQVLTIPTDHRGQLPINYAGPRKMFAYLSAGEVLDDKDTYSIEQRTQDENGEWSEKTIEVDKNEFLKNKNFIFGATATAIYDLRVTPFEENYPGVETHANLLDNLLRQDYLKTNPKEARWMPRIVLLLGILFSLIVSQFGALTGLFITLGSLATILGIDSYLIFPEGTVITIIFPIFSILLLYTLLTFFKYFTEERKKQQLKGTFQKYVSPEIVEEILKDPSKLELGGMKMEMSVFFSDIRGFTTISEKLDPKALSDLLNHYLTPMTDIIFKNSGTLDKYMGDAIMAFFGAPVPSKDHSAQACRAALEQIDKLFELQKHYQEQGLPMIDIGIGINTGEMSVGNMGSETVRNYTVMGDSVNLGSRLEGINKQYGTRIIISEFTKNRISADEFLYREIDWVKVKGKNEPVKIYELMDRGEVPQFRRDQVLKFNSGFQFYHEQQFEKAIQEFHAALSVDASDQTSQLYIKRCQDYMNNPPGDNWDGVFTMTTK